MKNLFKRKKTYYIRLTINQNLKIHFKNKREYIKSLETCNINNANMIARYLIAKFEFIKKSINMLSILEIEKLVKEFENIKFADIVNKYNYLKVEEIDTQIEQLQTNKYKKLIKNEMNDIINFLASKDEDVEAYGINEALGNKLESYIIQTKINALSEVKKSIKLENLQNTNINNSTNFVTIEEAIKEFFDSRVLDNEDKASENKIKKDVNIFFNFCKIEKIEFIQKIEYKNISNYKIYLKNLKPNAKVSTLNMNIKNISTFLNYCTNKAHYVHKLTIDIQFEPTIEELKASERDPFDEKDIKKMFDNLNLLKLTPKGILTKHNKEYYLILRIGLYAGARQNEILQLTKEDIKQDKESKIWYFDINANNGKKIKNINSIRQIPIHSKIQKEVLTYVKTLNQNNLFNISANKFSSDFSKFKTTLEFGEKKVFHSFRNTLQNDLKQKSVELAIIDELSGHAPTNSKMSLHYTKPYYLTILKEAIEKISYKN
jgi:integrase